jgi:peptidoglycan hydrolase-like protein with peptidoglycan-binding domain
MTTPPAISEGAAGPTVKLTQYLPVCWTVSYNQIDGIFGPVTKTAVEHLRLKSRMAVDGVVGPATWAARPRRTTALAGRGSQQARRAVWASTG